MSRVLLDECIPRPLAGVLHVDYVSDGPTNGLGEHRKWRANQIGRVEI